MSGPRRRSRPPGRSATLICGRARRRCPSVSYQDIFRDPRLQQLIAQALVNNRDLRLAAANIEVARAQYHIQRAAQLPEIEQRRRSHASATGGSGSGVGANYSVNVGVNAFELDLFGRLRSLSHAALDRYFATEAAARATRLTLVGDLATAWLDYAADKSLLAVAVETERNAARSVELTRARLQGGIAPRTDLDQAQTILDRRPIGPRAAAHLARPGRQRAAIARRRADRSGAAARLDRRSGRGGSPSCRPGSTARSSCAARTSSRPNMRCAPPMPRSALRAPPCSRASR